MTDQIEKLQQRLSVTENLVVQCKQIAESLASSRIAESAVPALSTTPKTATYSDLHRERSGETSPRLTTEPGSLSERNSDNDLLNPRKEVTPSGSVDNLKFEVEEEEFDLNDEIEENVATVPSINPELLDQIIQYFRTNLQSLVFFAGVIDLLLERMKPRNYDMNYRIAIVDYLKSQIRLSLSCSLFITDNEEIGSPTFAENKIVLSLLIGKSYQASWDSILFEHLQYLSETSAQQNQKSSSRTVRKSFDSPTNVNNFSSSFPFIDQQQQGENQGNNYNNASFDEDYPSSFVIKHITLHNNDPKTSPYLTCRINNRPVEIRTEPTSDLCFLSLLEEIAVLIGRDNLFKKSLSLISSFLFNEQLELIKRDSNSSATTTSEPSTTTTKAASIKTPIIPNTMLWIMVSAIFNKYYSFIETPLQALNLFLIEYLNYDPLTTVITLYGVLDSRSNTINNQQSMINSSTNSLFSPLGGSVAGPSTSLQTIFLGKSNYLIRPKILEKYWNAVNVEEVNVNSEIFNSTLVANPTLTKKFAPNLLVFYPYSPAPNSFNAIHPFSYQVLQTDSIQLNTTNNRISELFQFGLMKFNSLMETMSSIPRDHLTETIVIETVLEHVFPKIHKKLIKLESKPPIPTK